MNNPPAFPCGEYRVPFQGMTMRDYFAAKAMQGLLSSIGEWSAGTPNLEFSDSVASDAYWIADSMLEARKA